MMVKWEEGRWACVLLLLCALAMAGCRGATEPEARVPSDEDIALNNRGVGLMGRFEYEPARQAFAELLEKHPDWLDVKVNLAIATLNRQQEGDEAAALAILDEVLEAEPDHLRAQYVSGLLRLYLDEPQRAMEHFQFVAERDPSDAYAAYYIGQSHAQQREFEEALEWYERAIERDPYLRSAYYGKFQTYQRLGRAEDAEQMLVAFDRLKDNPRARLVEFVYTRMGPKGEALALGRPDAERAARPEGPVFAAPVSLIANGQKVQWNDAERDRPMSITVCDITGNGHLDVFIADSVRHDGAFNAVLVNNGTNQFALDAAHPLARVDRVNAAAWGDIDNNGLTDVYLLRDGPNQLWKQTERGIWESITEATGTANGSYNSVDGLIFDADHDGDLDLFIVNADGPNELLNNNLNGTFTPLAADRGIAGRGNGSRAIVAADLETDRDLDLVIVNEQPPHEVYLNDRLWEYRPMASDAPGATEGGFGDFLNADIVAAVYGDIEVNGRAELYTLDESGRIARWRADDDGRWSAERIADLRDDFDLSPAERTRAQLALVDVTGDGVQNLIVTHDAGWAAIEMSGDAPQLLHNAAAENALGWTYANFDVERGPSMLAISRQTDGDDLTISAWHPGPGRHDFAALTFSGREDAGQSMRSNASGIGTYYAARIGSRWTAGMTLRHHSGPGQSLQPVAIGLGGADCIDFVHIDWSDGVFQSEIDLAAGELHSITETQRQLASCPVLFAWDGEKFEFVSDVLGVGGIGFAVGPGEYAEPRPWERFLMPRGLLQRKDGRYILKLGEPMQEACYLDSARLVMYDLPPGWQMTIDERMGIAEPLPTGEPRFYRESILPRHAVNDRGEDITEHVREQDNVAAPVGEHDTRFLGMLQRDNVITLTFDSPLDSFGGKPTLIAWGWIEYPYSQTAFAAWQAGAAYRPPTIDALGADGEWVTILPSFGYPAGFLREMSVPLVNLPNGATKLRISTNQEIYWDQIFVAFVEDLPVADGDRQSAIGNRQSVIRTQLDLVEAELTRAGFARRILYPQRRAHYDYNNRAPLWDTMHQSGWYTAFGPVEQLIRRRNDALAIFGPGEEIHMEFAWPSAAGHPRSASDSLLSRQPTADSRQPPQGWTRRFVAEFDGWCKDMDLYTRDGFTLEPLPTHGVPDPAFRDRDELHERFNTRYQSGR